MDLYDTLLPPIFYMPLLPFFICHYYHFLYATIIESYMRIEIILFLITIFIIAHIYTDGKYTKLLFKWKKYYQMAAVVVGAFFIYWLIKHNHLQASQMIMA